MAISPLWVNERGGRAGEPTAPVYHSQQGITTGGWGVVFETPPLPALRDQPGPPRVILWHGTLTHLPARQKAGQASIGETLPTMGSAAFQGWLSVAGKCCART